MPDHATSASPAVQAQLDRLFAHGPGTDTLGLDRITRLLARLGDPHRQLPPVFHVAGTNGKGSTCAFLRAALEAAGHRVHVYTSPHLVRFNERVRLAGKLIEDDALAPLLAAVLDHAEDLRASFFEVTTAAAFLAFARTPADACVVEVGLGGRLDATNVIDHPLVTGIAALGLDHQAFLGDTLAEIAAEKAGIAKPGVPLVTVDHPAPLAAIVDAAAARAGAGVLRAGRDWWVESEADMLSYRDAQGALALPAPRLAGPHQAHNLGLAVAMLRHQSALAVPSQALAEGATAACWPARLQRLAAGPLRALVTEGTALWLDGGHNPAAGAAIAAALDAVVATPDGQDRRLVVILGMLANKDAAGLLRPLAGRVDTLIAVPVAGHACHAPADLARAAQRLGVGRTGIARDLTEAMALANRHCGSCATPSAVLIAGSLYLAGEALRLNDELPD